LPPCLRHVVSAARIAEYATIAISKGTSIIVVILKGFLYQKSRTISDFYRNISAIAGNFDRTVTSFMILSSIFDENCPDFPFG
jgi:hypothetical protein